MSDDTVTIHYRLQLPDGNEALFPIALDRQSAALVGAAPDEVPAWAALDFEQCPNCPFAVATTPACPAAARLGPLVRVVEQIYSHEHVSVTVVTEERTISAETTVQRAVGSLMGLIMASSGCPNLSFFRPMARFHLPFASPEETLFRATGAYLLTEALRQLDGGVADFDLNGLASDVYAEVQTVNRAFAERLRQASRADGAINALVTLDVLAQVLPMAIEDQLAELRPLFATFLDQPGATEAP